MIRKFQYGRQNPIWPPTCQKICFSRSDIDIESKEIYLIVVFQDQGIQFQETFDHENSIWPLKFNMAAEIHKLICLRIKLVEKVMKHV